ncbi:cyclic nucleotide-gated cation channel beta-1 [Schistocerca nitens]|uniref:cyclic nucleotide-gated cation channel beta-1 n=1 Tax=Schistocerca nitens TaxID=7011 RepID=UPI002117CD30|nr:cyclic nucleotide-gated cation channel beta-1 [Schistocerca nitens]
MDRIAALKKRMVYPERLALDSLKASMLCSEGSWANADSLEKGTDNPAHQISELELSCSQPGLRVSSSADSLSACASQPLAHHGLPLQSCANTCRSSTELNAILQRDGQMVIQRRLRELVRAFAERALRVRRRLELPPTPSTDSSGQADSNGISSPPLYECVETVNSEEQEQLPCTFSLSCKSFLKIFDCFKCNTVLDPQGICYVLWLLLVTVCYSYNCWVIPLRSTFPYQTEENTPVWLALDYSADAVYLMDILFFKPRLTYLSDGFWVKDTKLTRQRYFRKWQFKMDLLSLLPLDLFYLMFGPQQLLFRLPRLLKVQTFWEFYDRVDNILKSPYIVRMARTLSYMLFLIHVNACAYYAFSLWEGLGSNKWVFNGQGNAYIRCFYFATKTATSIGKNPKPENEQEYLFMTGSWLMGVFVFALLIGQMRDIVATATKTQTEYQMLLDETLKYMRRFNLPHKLQERVKLWFTYTWEQQHTIDESRILDALPQKLKTDVAINVHIQTLSKVQLFQDCDEALLRDLVLKLRPVIYLPGDYICRKGEVGKEMYIIKSGQIQVMGGKNNDEVLATLTEGCVFGEISLLSLAEGNRRTATVKSKGFSNIFVLNKSDLNEAIVHYPEAQEILRKKANSLMRQNALREKLAKEKQLSSDVIIGNLQSQETPKLVHTVIQVMGHLDISTSLIGRSPKQSKEESQEAVTTDKQQCKNSNSEQEHQTLGCSCSAGSENAGGCNSVSPADKTFECRVTVHREMSQ